MPGSSLARFATADDYEVGLRNIIPGLILTSGGEFAARTTGATLHHLRLFRAQEQRQRVAFVSFPRETAFVSFSLDPGLPLVWRGQTLDAGEIMLHGIGERLHQRTIGASCWGFVSLPQTTLSAFAVAMTGQALTLPGSGQILRPSAQDQKHLLRIHKEAARLAETRPRILSHPEVVRAMEQELACALVNCLTESERRSESFATTQAADVMVRFEDALASRDPQDWRLSELWAVAGVAERTLRRCCTVSLGLTPGQYMRLRKLRLVRAAIRRADPSKVRIGELARSGGFTDGGRFAALYRNAYGEAPSTTLRRSADA